MPMVAKPMLEVVKSFIKEDLKLLRGGPFCNWKTLSSQIFFVCCCALILSNIIFPSSVFSHASSTTSKLPSEIFRSTSDLSKLIFSILTAWLQNLRSNDPRGL